MKKGRRIAGFGPRLLLAQGVVILVGSVTLLGVTALLAPQVFRTHLDRVVGPIPAELSEHLAIAFGRATAISLSVATLAAALAALAVGWFITRRVVGPITAMAHAAAAVAAGDYTVRVGQSGLGLEFDEVSQSFNQMARSLAATERTRAELLRDVAHELRTPLTAIRVYHEALADGVFTADSETSEAIGAELARVERLVQDIARVSGAEERQLDLRPRDVSVQSLLETAVATASWRYADLGVDLELVPAEVAAQVRVDPDRFHEALGNLLDNALRHTPRGGRVTVSATAAGNSVEIAVIDTGDGLGAEDVTRVFERFYRVDDSRSRHTGGSGIGLAITRALVQAHGGSVRAESPGPGLGATFTIVLPCQTSRTSPLARLHSEARPAT